MPRIGINRVSKQGELNQRNAEHHREGESIAPHLREFFRDNPAQALKGKFGMPFHADCSIKLMNASSKPDGIWRQSYGSRRNGAMARSSSAVLVLLTCNELPKATACCTPGVLRSSSARVARSGPCTDQVVRPTLSMASSSVPSA